MAGVVIALLLVITLMLHGCGTEPLMEVDMNPPVFSEMDEKYAGIPIREPVLPARDDAGCLHGREGGAQPHLAAERNSNFGSG